MSPEFDRGWILGYTQGQYNMRRILLRKVLRYRLSNDAAYVVLAEIKKWLDEWPRKRRKVVKP